MATATTTRASVLRGPQDLHIIDRSLPPPARGELQLAIKATTLCGSDVHYWQDYRLGDFQVQEPLTLGHESAGVVVALGENVEGWKVGDRAALEVGIPCDVCERCLEGRYNLCPTIKFRSSARTLPHFQGTLQETLNHPAKWCHRLSDDVPFALGALVEPLSVAVHAVNRANLAANASILIIGAGPIGMLCAAACKATRTCTVKMVDIREETLVFAQSFGFADQVHHLIRDAGIAARESMEAAKCNALHIAGVNLKNAQDRAAELDFGIFDVVFECTGKETSTQTAIYATRAGGRVVLVGMGTPVQILPISAAALREVDIVGTFRYSYNYATAIRMLSDPQSPLANAASQLITHSYQGLDAAGKAFETASGAWEDGRSVLKVLIQMDQNH